MSRRLHVPLAPLRLAGFRYLFYATLGSSFGTLLAGIALAIDVKDRTDSGLWVGAVLIVEFLPTIVVGLLLGPLLDRLERRSLMIAADLLRAAVFVALPFANSPALIVALALVAGLATGFFRPAVFAGLPNLVPDAQLAEANALLQSVENASWAVGPVLGGLLTAAAGPDAAYWINAASFLVSVALLVRIPARRLHSEKALTRGHWRDLGDGFLAVLRSRPLLAVLVAWGIAELAVGAGNVAEIFLAKNTFAAGDFGYGLLYSAIGAGLVVGSFGSSAVLERFGIPAAYGGALAVMATGFAGAAASPDIWVAAVCCLWIGLGNGVAVICNAMLVQRGIADAARGRALTFVMSATYVLVGVGTVAGGAVLHAAGARWVWGVSAPTLLLAGIAGWWLARGTSDAGEQAPEIASAPAAAAN
ncbi:MAG TPA: MFS transporter [Gaiellaceae bacterium]|nr:MFS transporter [Gaiellaceae bacterium]